MTTCIVCDKEVGNGDPVYFIPIEKPYANVKVHRVCFMGVKNDLGSYLSKNIDKVYSYLEEKSKEKNGKR